MGDVDTVETGYPHIVIRHDKGPVIAGTRMRVTDLVEAQQVHGYSPEELAFQYPTFTLGQIHSALAYYWDHQQELDEDMARRLEVVEELRARTPVPPLVERLRAIKAQRLRASRQG